MLIGPGDEEVYMEEVTCGMCHARISNWEMASGKCTVFKGKLVHKCCSPGVEDVKDVPTVYRPPDISGV